MKNISLSDYLLDYLELEGISQQELSHNLDISQSQLSLILNKKREISYNLMVRISMVTPFSLEEMVKIESNYAIESSIVKEIEEKDDTFIQYLKRYQYKKLEAYDNDIIFKNINDPLEAIKDIMQYLRISNPYTNKLSNVHFKSKHNKVELVNIWLEKCYRQTKGQNISEYNKDNLNKVIKKIEEFAKDNYFNSDELVQIFNNNGIYLSIVDDIDGSKIRGAFRVIGNKPAIYLTMKHKRPADIYFALLHEIAHCKTDFNSAKNKTYISIDQSMLKKVDNAEYLADQKAYNWMISEDVFERVKSSYDGSNFDELADTYQVPPMFLAYRLAESNTIKYSDKAYQENNPVIREE